MINEQRYDAKTTVESLLKVVPSINKNTSCIKVLDLFHLDKTIYSLPVVDDQDKPVGMILRLELTEFFSKPYSKELQGKKPISILMDKKPIIVDKSTGIEDISRIVLDAGIQHMVSGFIITAENRYLGIATGYDLLNEITNQKQKYLFDLAHFDQLTGLPNRRLLLDRLQHALASSARSGKRGALLFIDLDRFKIINDTLGHSVGDLLLQQVAQRLRACVRETDTVARLGGDEFIVMLEGLNHGSTEATAQIEAVGEKLVAKLGQPYQLADHTHRVTPSIGATLFNAHSQSPAELMKQADTAMYRVKETGCNAMCLFDPDMSLV